MSEAEATRLADALSNITFVNGKWQALDEAAALLRQWPDGEPVAWTLRETLERRETTTQGRLWFSDPQNDAWFPLYTAPPDQSARIAELEAALKVAGEALSAMLTHMGMDEDEWNKPTFDQARAALQQIKEAQR